MTSKSRLSESEDQSPNSDLKVQFATHFKPVSQLKKKKERERRVIWLSSASVFKYGKRETFRVWAKWRTRELIRVVLRLGTGTRTCAWRRFVPHLLWCSMVVAVAAHLTSHMKDVEVLRRLCYCPLTFMCTL